jgi:hypothetical protein
MIDERIIGSTVDRRGFARVDTLPKSIAATIADKYPIIMLELVKLLKINLNPCIHDAHLIDIKTYSYCIHLSKFILAINPCKLTIKKSLAVLFWAKHKVTKSVYEIMTVDNIYIYICRFQTLFDNT